MGYSNDFKFDFILRDIQTKLKILFISLTNKCNLNCLHCGTGAGRLGLDVLKTNGVKDIIWQFANMGGEHLVITGGEPLLRNDFLDILLFALNSNLQVNIETNGLLLNPELLNQIRIYNKQLHFCVSLDGFSSDSHDWFRRKNGAFKIALKNLENYLSSDIAMSVSTILHKKNIPEIKRMTEYLVFKLNIMQRVVPFISTFGRGSGAAAREASLSNHEVFAFLDKIYFPLYQRAKQAGLEKLMFVDLPKALLPPYIKVSSDCGWGLTMAGINTNGQLGICHRIEPDSRFSVQGISIRKRINLQDSWNNHKVFREIRGVDRSTLTGVCSNCKFNLMCRGHCRLLAFNTYNNIYAPYPVCQSIYNDGLFPEKSLIDIKKDCTYVSSLAAIN
jgi:AdoMet-dependent heme synthase